MNKYIRRSLAIAVGGVVAVASTWAFAQDEVSVAIGQRGLWDTMVVHHGVQNGFFAEEGIEVDITWTSGGAETLQAVTTNSVDMGFVNGTLGVLGAFKSGAPVRIIGAQITGASDLYWYAPTDSGIETLADADGKSIGYSRPGSSTNLVLLGLVEQEGIDAELVSAGGISATRTQVMSGQLDVGWSVPPFGLDLVESGEIQIITTGADLESASDQTVRVNLSNTRFLSQRRDVAERFMRVYERTIDWMYDNDTRDEAIRQFADFNDISIEIARESASFYPRQALRSVPVRGLDQTMTEAIENGAIREPLTEAEIDTLIDYVYDPR